MFTGLSINEYIFAAVLAFFLTWMAISFGRILKAQIKKSIQAEVTLKNLNEVKKKCYLLFPLTEAALNGVTLTRDMKARLTVQDTSGHKTVEGQFMGANQENFICILTAKQIVSLELSRVTHIEILP